MYQWHQQSLESVLIKLLANYCDCIHKLTLLSLQTCMLNALQSKWLDNSSKMAGVTGLLPEIQVIKPVDIAI